MSYSYNNEYRPEYKVGKKNVISWMRDFSTDELCNDEVMSQLEENRPSRIFLPTKTRFLEKHKSCPGITTYLKSIPDYNKGGKSRKSKSNKKRRTKRRRKTKRRN
jgi:hypothetical protein